MGSQHLLSRAVRGATFALVLAMGGALSATAEEAGQWHGKGVLVIIARNATEVEGLANHRVSTTEYDGAVFNGDGKPFLDKARYHVVALLDSGVTSGGYKTFTASDGSRVIAKFTSTEVKLPEINGTFEFTNGTGKYEGITGKGTFHFVFVSDKAAWDELSGEYHIPTK